ncbi:hypothetical protein NPIL_221281 [Nephila pilipes]|uniref:Uncharacterized protein n=1 Tax=Nephila pilipes TaxID=299642 RepID=A0A8X6UUZ3_NEPPI|nr:hypothetical protein NPIL_221281 [Nephila pilipes]
MQLKDKCIICCQNCLLDTCPLIHKRSLNDGSMDSNVRAINRSESCVKTNFSHDQKQVENLMNQFEESEIADIIKEEKGIQEKDGEMKDNYFSINLGL